MGLALLVLVDAPRRALAQLAFLKPGNWRGGPDGGGSPGLAFLSPSQSSSGQGQGGTARTAIVNALQWRPTRRERAPRPLEMEGTPLVVPPTIGTAPSGRRRIGQWFSQLPSTSRDLAYQTGRLAQRVAAWLLGR
jgi:hypothetical protein